MKTLIELYDERPLENVLSAEMFRPERIVYICPETVFNDKQKHLSLVEYFKHRGIELELVFLKTRFYEMNAILELLRETVIKYPDCALDVSGGTDDALFAAGRLSAEMNLPVFTYSRKLNRYFSISGAPFDEELDCNVKYNVEDFFLMAGGSMHMGRVDNAVLDKYMDDIDPYFELYLRNRRKWQNVVNYVQRISKAGAEGYYSLEVSGDYTVKGDRGRKIDAPEDVLREYEEIGFISELNIDRSREVSFKFRDSQIRSWMRDIGSVLELYVYKACIDSGVFNDVRTSAVVYWEGYDSKQENAVSNELDVMCAQGVTPVFISCKTGAVQTEALNELAILRDRFGSNMAKAAIVTADRGGGAMRNRASELGITVIDINDLSAGRTVQRIKKLMNSKK